MTVDPERLEAFERDMDLFSLTADEVPVWERIRFNTFREIRRQNGRGQAHTGTGEGLREHLRGIYLWAKNTLFRNPFLASDHEFLFFGHPRRKLEDDGYWWDLYCDPIHVRDELDYVHIEPPHNLSHKTPARTPNLRYNELIQFTGTLQRRIGLKHPSIPDKVVTRLRNAESEIEDRFDADVDLVEDTEHVFHVRNTLLPLYKRLLDHLDPAVVVDVVSYGDETLIEACKHMGIPTVELQHGVIYDHHYGYSYPENETKVMFPDYLLTFGEFWAENTRFPIPDDRVIPVGYPYLEDRLDAYDDVDQREQMLFISQGTIGHELSAFALAVDKDPRIDHDVVYKLHPGEYDRWRDDYPKLADSNVTVVDKPEPPLYRLFAESSVQVGVGSTAVYEGLCFDLETFVFDIDDADVLRPLITDGAATLVEDVEDLAVGIDSGNKQKFDRRWFFKSHAIDNIVEELKQIKSK